MNTFYIYRNVVETHIIPYFGIQKIKYITLFMVETFYFVAYDLQVTH
ncbi:hypothetical protein ACIQD3_22310 [Peribacillus loiseleuriae]